MASLSGKVVLITGGTKGIGRATAVLFAKAGASVVVNYSSDSSSADSLVKEIGAAQCHAVQADAGNIAACEAMVQQALTKFGHLDIVIANAGVLPMKNLEGTTEADFDATYNLNVKGPYFLAQKAAPHLPDGGRIIFVSTSVNAVSHVQPNYLLYCSTKGAIEQMTRVIAKELAPKGIRVNAVAPGPTATDLFMRGKPDALVNTLKGFSPFNKLGEPEEIGDVMLFLASEQSRWVAGQVLRVNGSMV